MVRIGGSTTCTYLYLNGLAVRDTVELGGGVTLMPVRSTMSDSAAPSCASVEDAVRTIFLRDVRSQLRVVGSNVEETATRAWNALWDAFLLGVIGRTEIVCNLQADVALDDLSSPADVRVTNYHLRGAWAEMPYVLTEQDAEWIATHFEGMRRLLDKEEFTNAVHSFATAAWHPLGRAQLALLWSGIEGLFGVSTELSFRLSLYAARFLHPDDHIAQVGVFQRVKALYRARSQAVHGARGRDENGAVSESQDLLRFLILRCAELRALPDVESLAP